MTSPRPAELSAGQITHMTVVGLVDGRGPEGVRTGRIEGERIAGAQRHGAVGESQFERRRRPRRRTPPRQATSTPRSRCRRRARSRTGSPGSGARRAGSADIRRGPARRSRSAGSARAAPPRRWIRSRTGWTAGSPRVAQIRSSAATEALARSRSIFDRKPLVNPLASATSSSVRRWARRTALSRWPILAVLRAVEIGRACTHGHLLPPVVSRWRRLRHRRALLSA